MIALLLAFGCADARDAVRQVKEVADAAVDKAKREPLPCGDEITSAAPEGCLSGKLVCGETIEGNTTGGDSRWDDDFYAEKFCFPRGDDRGGPERTYLIEVPPYTDVQISMQSDCVDLDLTMLTFGYSGSCPTIDHAIQECESDEDRGDGLVRVQNFANGGTYLVAVDGKHRAVGPFRLTVTCQPIRKQ